MYRAWFATDNRLQRMFLTFAMLVFGCVPLAFNGSFLSSFLPFASPPRRSFTFPYADLQTQPLSYDIWLNRAKKQTSRIPSFFRSHALLKMPGHQDSDYEIPSDDSCSEASIDEVEFNEHYADDWRINHEKWCECADCEKFRDELSALSHVLKMKNVFIDLIR